MRHLNLIISIITLNVNDLKNSNQRAEIVRLARKQDSTHFKNGKNERMEKDIPC